MKIDYHMHFEYGSYDLDWVRGFFESAKERGLDEIGISEHSHTFKEFEELYYEDLILDDSEIGSFQQKWLKTNKFKYTIDEYFSFMEKVKKKYPNTKVGIEVCNFKNQEKVKAILQNYPFDYIIGSIHFLDGWGYDASKLIKIWDTVDLKYIYETYTKEVENMLSSGEYDILGHPFNIRLFKYFPDFDVKPYIERVCQIMKDKDVAIDINTGTFYRYPVKEISPYGEFMEIAKKYNLKIITSSDAHKPEDCGRYIDDAVNYAKEYGFSDLTIFTKREKSIVNL